MEADRRTVAKLTDVADRLDALADIAELMGDDDGAVRLRRAGSHYRIRAMALLDQNHRRRS